MLKIENKDKILGKIVNTHKPNSIWVVNRIDEIVTNGYDMVYEIIMRGRGITRSIVEVPIHLYRTPKDIGYKIQIEGMSTIPTMIITGDELKNYDNVLIAIQNLLIQNGK